MSDFGYTMAFEKIPKASLNNVLEQYPPMTITHMLMAQFQKVFALDNKTLMLTFLLGNLRVSGQMWL
jgi:hypothetical protein